MWYAIWTEDHPDSLPLRLTHRPAHLARLHQLRDAGRLMLAGPLPALDQEDPGEAGYTGSLIVADFTNLEEAQSWLNAEPYLLHGVYAKATVKPFRKTLP